MKKDEIIENSSVSDITKLKEGVKRILAKYQQKYERMSTDRLVEDSGKIIVENGVTIKIIRPMSSPDMLYVNIFYSDNVHWFGDLQITLTRDISQPDAVDWVREGF